MLLRGSLLLRNPFLPHGNENDQLLQYGYVHQLSIRVSIKRIDARTCVVHTYAGWCEMERLHFGIIIEQNETLTFYWLLL